MVRKRLALAAYSRTSIDIGPRLSITERDRGDRAMIRNRD